MKVSGQFTLLPLYPREKRIVDTHFTGGWVGPRAVLDTVVKSVNYLLSYKRIKNVEWGRIRSSCQTI